MSWQSDLVQAAILVGMIELILHWLPWRLFFSRDLPRLAAYVLDVLGLLAPLSWLLERWGHIQALQALWVVAITGGLAALIGSGVDAIGVGLARRREAEELEAQKIARTIIDYVHPEGSDGTPKR